ncbi:SH3 domain-containing protein [Bdellovibrionota bacterium FG-2]
MNLIKVDKAPAGEHVLLPEPSEDPILGQQAADRLGKYIGTKTMPKNMGPITHIDGKTTFPPPLPELTELVTSPPPLPPPPAARDWTRAILPTAIGIAGIMAIGSGVYIYWKGEALYERAKIAAKTETLRNESAKPAPVSFTENNDVVRAPSMPLTDQVHQNAMAPTRVNTPEPVPPPTVAAVAPESARMKIRARLAAKLHTGPGLEFPVVGVANPETTYPVIDWSNRWFKISLPGETGEKSKNQAWIRNDLIQLVQ